jgi:hypothetical protein
LELAGVGFSIETWHSWVETLDPATGQCAYRSWAWLGNRIVVKMFGTGMGWVSVLRPWHSRAETLDPATGQCVYRSWAWLGNLLIIYLTKPRDLILSSPVGIFGVEERENMKYI